MRSFVASTAVRQAMGSGRCKTTTVLMDEHVKDIDKLDITTGDMNMFRKIINTHKEFRKR